MAVLLMQRITICALKKDRKKILELLQRRGVIEINETIPEDSTFHKMDVSTAENLLNKNIASAKEALQILAIYAPYKKEKLGMLKGRSVISTEVYDKFALKLDSVVNSTNKICYLNKHIAEQKAEILRLNTQWEMLSAWTSLDIPMNFSGTKYTSSFIGTLPNAWTLDMLYEKLAEQMPLNVDIVSSTRDQTAIFVLCAKEKASSVSESLRSIGFSFAATSIDKAPAKQRKDIEKQIEEANFIITTATEEIKSFAEQRENIRFLIDYDVMRAEKYDVID